LDVAFLWHLHRLQPGLYEEDCQQLKGRDGKSLKGALHVTPQQVRGMNITSSRKHWLVYVRVRQGVAADMAMCQAVTRAWYSRSLAVPAAVADCIKCSDDMVCCMHVSLHLTASPKQQQQQ
jgi:hypothetical protein